MSGSAGTVDDTNGGAKKKRKSNRRTFGVITSAGALIWPSIMSSSQHKRKDQAYKRKAAKNREMPPITPGLVFW